jgi:hypothetical protein
MFKGWGARITGAFNDLLCNLSPTAQARSDWALIESYGWSRGRHQTEWSSHFPGQHGKRTDWEANYTRIDNVSPERVTLLRGLLKDRNVTFKEGNTTDIDPVLGDHRIFMVRGASFTLMSTHVSIKDDVTMTKPSTVHSIDATQVLARQPVKSRLARSLAAQPTGKANGEGEPSGTDLH